MTGAMVMVHVQAAKLQLHASLHACLCFDMCFSTCTVRRHMWSMASLYPGRAGSSVEAIAAVNNR